MRRRAFLLIILGIVSILAATQWVGEREASQPEVGPRLHRRVYPCWSEHKPPTLRKACFDRGRNATWLRHKYFGPPGRRAGTRPPTPSAPISDAEVVATARQLSRLGITDLYFHAGPLDAHGDVPAWDQKAWAHRLRLMRREIPGLRAFAWLGGVSVREFGVAPDTIDLSKASVRTRIISTARRMVDSAGFDGIHYDIETILSGDPDFLVFLDESRAGVSPHPVSVAAAFTWQSAYIHEAARRCEQLAVMSYDCARVDAKDYSDALGALTYIWCEAMEGTSCRFLAGVPTYEPGPGHDPAIENVVTAAAGIKDGLSRLPGIRPFQGVALYAHWTTTDAVWKEFERDWVRPKPKGKGRRTTSR